MTWHSIGLESRLQTILDQCENSQTGGGGIGHGGYFGRGAGWNYGNDNGDSISLVDGGGDGWGSGDGYNSAWGDGVSSQ